MSSQITKGLNKIQQFFNIKNENMIRIMYGLFAISFILLGVVFYVGQRARRKCKDDSEYSKLSYLYYAGLGFAILACLYQDYIFILIFIAVILNLVLIIMSHLYCKKPWSETQPSFLQRVISGGLYELRQRRKRSKY